MYLLGKAVGWHRIKGCGEGNAKFAYLCQLLCGSGEASARYMSH